MLNDGMKWNSPYHNYFFYFVYIYKRPNTIVIHIIAISYRFFYVSLRIFSQLRFYTQNLILKNYE